MTLSTIGLRPSYNNQLSAAANFQSEPDAATAASQGTGTTSVRVARLAGDGNVSLERVGSGFKMSETPRFAEEITFSGGGGKGFGYPGVCAALLDSGAAKAAKHFWGASAGAYTAACMSVTPRKEQLALMTNAPANFFEKMNGVPDPDHPGRVLDDKFSMPPSHDTTMLLARMGANGLPLMQDAQDLILREASQHIRQRLQQPDLAAPQRMLLEHTLNKMQRNPPEWTFGMLADLHQVMPESFKHLSIAVTAVGPEGSRALICSSEDDRFRGVSICQIARASAAFPGAFARVDIPANFPIKLAPGTQLHDGGVLLNTPFRTLTDPNARVSKMPRNDCLIFRFNAHVASSSSVGGMVSDLFAEASNGAAEDWVHDKLEQIPDLARQTVTLDMQTPFGDFSQATLDLGMSSSKRMQLQQHLQRQVDQHLEQMMHTPVVARFDSALEALLEQPLEIVAQFIDQADQEIADAAYAVSNFREHLEPMLGQLFAAINRYQADPGKSLDLKQIELRRALQNLDCLANDPALRRAVVEHLLPMRGNAQVQRLLLALKQGAPRNLLPLEQSLRKAAVTQDRQALRPSIELHLYSGLHLLRDGIALRPQSRANSERINLALAQVENARNSLEASAALLELKSRYDFGAIQEVPERRFTDGLTHYAAESLKLLRQERPNLWRDLLKLTDQDFSRRSGRGVEVMSAQHPFADHYPLESDFVSQELVALAKRIEANRR